MTKRQAALAAGIWGAFLTSTLAAAPAQAQSIESERAANPQLAHALDQLKRVEFELLNAPGDYGGRKARAVDDVRRAMHSLRGALYWRLHLDESQWDRY